LPILEETEPPILAFHAACLVLPSEFANHSKLNILKYPDIGVGRRINTKVFFNFIIWLFYNLKFV